MQCWVLIQLPGKFTRSSNAVLWHAALDILLQLLVVFCHAPTHSPGVMLGVRLEVKGGLSGPADLIPHRLTRVPLVRPSDVPYTQLFTIFVNSKTPTYICRSDLKFGTHILWDL